jgi:hypothetical protein
MQTPPTPVTDRSHICRFENSQSSEVPSEYCAQYGVCACKDDVICKAIATQAAKMIA